MPDEVSVDWSVINEAIRVWIGHHRAGYPTRDDARIVQRFGEKRAAEILPRLRALETEFYTSNARLAATTIQEMGDTAAAEFKAKYPAISDDAVEKLALCYTYDFR